MTEQPEQPAVDTDTDEEPTGHLYVSMTVSIDQPDTSSRATSATVRDVDDLAEEILTAAGGLAQMAGVGGKFRELVSPCLHVQMVHAPHDDATTKAALNAAKVAQLLGNAGFSTGEPTDDLAAAVYKLVTQRNAKQTILNRVGESFNIVRREGDPLETAPMAARLAELLADYRNNIAQVMSLDPATSSDSGLIGAVVGMLGILDDVDGDQVGAARAAYDSATKSVDWALGAADGDVVEARHIRPLLSAVWALGKLLGKVDEPVAAPEPAVDPVAAQG